jgi:phosphorylcholine metabolism protein LicD
MDSKVRNRSNEELLIRKSEFLKICEILDKLKINYFLQTGILLGAIRDNDLIKWDWDIEISVFSDDFFPSIDLVANDLKKNGFKILKINKKKDDSKIDFVGKYSKEVTGYTIFSWNYSRTKDLYWRRELTVPSKFLKTLSTINFFGREFKCPNNPEEYLEFSYGDWKTPIRTSDKELYMTGNYRNKLNSFLSSLKTDFLRTIYSVWKFVKK